MNGRIDTVVLDTNAVIELLNDSGAAIKLDAMFPHSSFCISVITFIELLGYPSITPNVERQILNFLRDITIVNIDSPIVEIAIAMRREKVIKLPDAVIAATAVTFNAPLVTRDADILKFKYDGLFAISLS